jgi:hypothetical protein
MQSEETNTPAAQCADDYRRADVEKWYTRREPTTGQATKYREIHAAGRQLALLFCDTLPPGRARDLALDRLQESIQWAETSIARDVIP